MVCEVQLQLSCLHLCCLRELQTTPPVLQRGRRCVLFEQSVIIDDVACEPGQVKTVIACKEIQVCGTPALFFWANILKSEASLADVYEFAELGEVGS